MIIENNRRPSGLAMQHRGSFFTSVAHLHEQVVPLVVEAVRRGDTVAVAVSTGTLAALAAAGVSANALVELEPAGRAGHSGQTVAARRAMELRKLSGPITMIVEHDTELDGYDGSFWTELDAAFNISLADLPVELTCFYPDMPLHQEVLDGALRNHPVLLARGIARENPVHTCPRAVLGEHPAPAPKLLGAPELRIAFGAWQLNEVRAAVEEQLVAAGYGRSRAEDVVLAVNEVATNAVEHGPKEAELYLWLESDDAICEIHDNGELDDPLPGLQAPHASQPRGRGVWIARQICESLHIWSDAKGTHVRMHAGRPV